MKQSTSWMKQSTYWNAHGQGQEDDRETRSRDDGKLHGSASDGVRRRSGGTFALTLVAIQLGLMFVGALMPTPLYPLYRQAFGFSGIVLTLIFAVYVLGNLLSLLLLGRLADQIGRRKASLPAIGFGLASAAIFAAAAGTSWLFAARLLSGLATGLAAGAATAWIAELYSGRTEGGAARIASAANFFGCAAGPLLAGLLAQFAFWPLQLSFLVHLVLLCIIAGGLFLVPETMSHRRGPAQLALKPRIGVPPHIRLQFVAPAVTGFATFALIGFYGALLPNLLASSLHQPAPAIAGAVVCALFLVAALTILSSGRLQSQAAMMSGLALLPPSLWLLVGAQLAQSMPILLLATAFGGISGGFGYRGSLEVINRIAPADRRSEVVSSYMVAVFAGNSLPVIGIGVLSATTDSLIAHIVFAALTTILAGLAALTGIRYAPKE
jgi:predicted MFS family arabinose efflux permease